MIKHKKPDYILTPYNIVTRVSADRPKRKSRSTPYNIMSSISHGQYGCKIPVFYLLFFFFFTKTATIVQKRKKKAPKGPERIYIAYYGPRLKQCVSVEQILSMTLIVLIALYTQKSYTDSSGARGGGEVCPFVRPRAYNDVPNHNFRKLITYGKWFLEKFSESYYKRLLFQCNAYFGIFLFSFPVFVIDLLFCSFWLFFCANLAKYNFGHQAQKILAPALVVNVKKYTICVKTNTYVGQQTWLNGKN